MEHQAVNPPLVIALALAAGIVAQSVAQHLRIPGIVVLVATGILLGPDGVGVIVPDQLGEGLRMLVGFAIAVILFEGGLNLQWRRLRGQARTIRRLITWGALVTWGGGTLAARLVLGWDWTNAVLFGSLVIVTGPTVITPILRRSKVDHKLQTILEAEGVFIDAVGALIAIVTLEVALSFSSESLRAGFLALPTRLVAGLVFGLIGGALMALLLRVRGIVPQGLENVFTLSLALALFQGSNALFEESGIAAVIVAGLVVGNSRTAIGEELKEFKEQLTVMLIGLLFVLLAAAVPVRDVLELAWPGILVVLALMLLVRPAGVLLCTLGSSLTWRDKAFLSWLAPRGIVAAAVAAVFYDRMEHHGVAGGEEMRALVFLVIAVTVVFQGGTAGLVAHLLGVRRPRGCGYVIVGAHHLARMLGRLFKEAGEEVALVDSAPGRCAEAEAEGFRVYHGNAIEERLLLQVDLETRRAALAMLRNEGVNLIYAQRALEYDVPRVCIAVQAGERAVTPEMVHETGAVVLFGGEADIDLWDVRVRRGLARLEVRRREPAEKTKAAALSVPKEMQNRLLPLAVVGERTAPIDDRLRVATGDEVAWLVFTEREDEVRAWFDENGWTESGALPRRP